MKKRILQFLLVLLIMAIAYLTLYPVPFDPQAWTPDPDPGLTGPYAPNTKLTNVRKMADGQCLRCEDIAVDSLGNVYGGSYKGDIIAFSPDFKTRRVLTNTGGRPLGMIVDKKGNIYVADSPKGLLRVKPSGEITVLTDMYNNQKIIFADDLDFGPDSTIIFSEASEKFPDTIHVTDLLEHGPNGNVFRYSLKTGKTEQLLDSLYFANGIAVAPDGSFVLVNNMGKYQVLKHFLSGPRKGQTEVFIDNLPGFPDGVNIGPDGTIWVSVPGPRVAILDKLLPYPFLRKVSFRLPQNNPETKPYGIILGFDQSGKLTHNLQDPKGGYSGITNTVPFQNKLYLGSITQTSIGVYDLTQAQ